MEKNNVKLYKKPTFWILIGCITGAIATSLYRPMETHKTVYAKPITNTLSPLKFKSIGNIDEEYEKLVEAVKPTVVHIEVGGKVAKSGEIITPPRASGSGVIIQSDNTLGYAWVVTNRHVVDRNKNVTVVLHDGKKLMGSVYSSKDPAIDIAVVKIESNGLRSIPFANSNEVKEGQMCLAIGSPMGFNHTITYGKISSIHRSRSTTNHFADVIQTDASINPGNSGGPLIVLEKKGDGFVPGIAGINTFIASQSGGSQGLGFAIKSNFVKLIANMLIQKKRIERGMIGITPEDLKDYQKNELKIKHGAFVADISKNMPADKAGMKKDDIIIKIQNRVVKSAQDVINYLLEYGASKKLSFTVLRDQKTIHLGIKPILFSDYMKKMERKQRMRNPQQDMLEDLLRQFGFGFGAPRGFGFPQQDPREFEYDDEDEDSHDTENSNSEPSKEKNTQRAKLGISVNDLDKDIREKYFIPANASGAVVASITPGALAEKYNFKIGDLITSVSGKKVKSSQDLLQVIKSIKAGETHPIKISRFTKNSRQTIEWNITF